jgi:hypothetical protein
VAIHFAHKGVDVSIIYKNEDQNAVETQKLVEAEGKQCLLLAGDVRDLNFCENVIKKQ